MRFVIDARRVGPTPTGIGNYTRALVERLPGLAPEVSFHLWVEPRAEKPLVDAPNVTERTIAAAPNGIRTLLWTRHLDRLSREDVLHCPANTMGRALPCATVVTIHDLMWMQRPELCEPNPILRPIRSAFFSNGIRRALRAATRILTVSYASADEIVRAAPEAKRRVRVTYNAVDERFAPAEDADAARSCASSLLGTERPFFIVLGRDQPSKGHPTAMRAFARVARKGEHLVLLQRPRLGHGLHRIATNLGILDRVHFVRQVDTPDLVALLQSANALLQPSLSEGFGIPVLEAMACGCPVVASDIPPLREVLGEAGTLVPINDGVALGAAMRRLTDDPILRQERSAQGLERARQFSWDKTAAQTLEVYREAAAEGAV
jgi:glycosyltransferase involved in cell wall biosynthesis